MRRQVEKAGGSSASKILWIPAAFSVVTLFLLALACEEGGQPVSSPTEVELAARLKASCGLSESGDAEALESNAGVSSPISRQICAGFEKGEEKAALNQYTNILKKLIDGQPLGGPELDQLNGLFQLTLEEFNEDDPAGAQQLIEDLVLVTTGESIELGGNLEDTDTFLIPPSGGTFTHDNGLLALVFGAWGNTATVVCTKLSDDSAPLNYDEDRQFPQFVDCVMIPNIDPISPPYSMTSCIKEDVVPDDIEDLLALAKNDGEEGIVIGDEGGTPGPVPNCPDYGAESEVILSRHGGEAGPAADGKREAPGGLDLAGKTGVGQFSAMTPFGFVDTTATTTATIEGFVLSGEDSVPDATVRLFCDGPETPTATTSSNVDGFYSFDNAEDPFEVGDDCFLTAQAAGPLGGREPPEGTFTVESGENVRNIDVFPVVG